MSARDAYLRGYEEALNEVSRPPLSHPDILPSLIDSAEANLTHATDEVAYRQGRLNGLITASVTP